MKWESQRANENPAPEHSTGQGGRFQNEITTGYFGKTLLVGSARAAVGMWIAAARARKAFSSSRFVSSS